MIMLDSMQLGGLVSQVEQMQMRQQERLLKGLSALIEQVRNAEEGERGTAEQRLAGKRAAAENDLLDACEELENAKAKLERRPEDSYALEGVASAEAKVSSLRRRLACIEKHGHAYGAY